MDNKEQDTWLQKIGSAIFFVCLIAFLIIMGLVELGFLGWVLRTIGGGIAWVWHLVF